MDYCEIILDSVHKVVTSEMAKELKGLDGVLTIAQVLESKNNNTYIVQESGGRRVNAKADKELILAVNDYVYLNDTTIVAKKLDNSQVSIEINESLKDFIFFQKGNKELILNNPRVCNRLLLTAKVEKTATKDSNYHITVRVSNNEGRIYEFDFTNADLMGRLGYLQGSLQKQMYSLNLGTITKATASFDTNTYSSVELALGSNAEGLKDEMGLKLFTSEKELEYKTDTKGQVINITFPLQWTWIYTNEQSILCLESSEFDSIQMIKYYRYNENYNTGDEYGGLNWEAIQLSDNEINQLNLLPNSSSTRIKAVIVNGQEIITSNEIEFKNTQLTREGIISNLNLKFNDKRNGRYPLYSPSGTLLDEYIIEACQEKQITFTYVNIDESKDINDLVESVIWTVDLDKIELSQNMKSDTAVRISYMEPDSLGNLMANIDTTNRTKTVEKTKGENTITEEVPNWQNLEFFIKDSIDFLAGLEDLITCTVMLKGDDEPYKASTNLVFTTDTFGDSNYAIFVDLKEQNTDNIVHAAKWTKNYELVVSVYDKEGNLVDFELDEIGWYGNSTVLAGGEHCFKTPTKLSSGGISIVSASKGTTNDKWKSPDRILEASHIIKFNIKVKTANDNKKYTIPYLYPLSIMLYDNGNGGAPNENWIYKGPKKIVYNAAGVLKGGSTWDFEIVDQNTKESVEEAKFLVSTNDWGGTPNNYRARNDDYEIVSSYNDIPAGYWFPIAERVRGGKYKLIASSIYDSSIDTNGQNKYLYNLYWEKNKVAFCQPIVAYRDVEFSSYISDWNGGLTVDEENNAVLAASMVAGSKDTNNKFTGVVIGDISNISNVDGYTTSGILGFNQNTQVFSLSNDGKATFGKSGSGQIKFDGTSGTISGGTATLDAMRQYTESGMVINLDDQVSANGTTYKSGSIHAKNFALMPDGSVYMKQGDLGGEKIIDGYWTGVEREGHVNYILSGHVYTDLTEGTSGIVYQSNLSRINDFEPGAYTVTICGKIVDNYTQMLLNMVDSTGKTAWKFADDSNQYYYLKMRTGIQRFSFELTSEDLKDKKSMGLYFTRAAGKGYGGYIDWIMITHGKRLYETILFPSRYDQNINSNLLSVDEAFKAKQNKATDNVLAKYPLSEQGLQELITYLTPVMTNKADGTKEENWSSSSEPKHKFLTVTLKGDLANNKVTRLYFQFEKNGNIFNVNGSNSPVYYDGGRFRHTLDKEAAHIVNSEYYLFGLTFTKEIKDNTSTVGSERQRLYNWLKLAQDNKETVYLKISQYKDSAELKDRVAVINAAKLEIGARPTHINISNDVIEDWGYIPDTATTTIVGGQVSTYSINANKICVSKIKSPNVGQVYGSGSLKAGYTDDGTVFDLVNGNIHSKNFQIVDGNAKFKGHVESSSGTIAGWGLTDKQLESVSYGKKNSENQEVTADSTTGTIKYTVYIAKGLSHGNPTASEVFAVKRQTRTSTSAEWGSTSWPFWVSTSGCLHSNDANITQGTIGGWTLSSNSLVYGTIANGNSCSLYTGNQSAATTILGYNSNKWRMTIGTNFGILNDGTVRTNNLNVFNTLQFSESGIKATSLVDSSALIRGVEGGFGYGPSWREGLKAILDLNIANQAPWISYYNNTDGLSFEIPLTGTIYLKEKLATTNMVDMDVDCYFLVYNSGGAPSIKIQALNASDYYVCTFSERTVGKYDGITGYAQNSIRISIPVNDSEFGMDTHFFMSIKPTSIVYYASSTATGVEASGRDLENFIDHNDTYMVPTPGEEFGYFLDNIQYTKISLADSSKPLQGKSLRFNNTLRLSSSSSTPSLFTAPLTASTGTYWLSLSNGGQINFHGTNKNTGAPFRNWNLVSEDKTIIGRLVPTCANPSSESPKPYIRLENLAIKDSLVIVDANGVRETLTKAQLTALKKLI